MYLDIILILVASSSIATKAINTANGKPPYTKAAAPVNVPIVAAAGAAEAIPCAKTSLYRATPLAKPSPCSVCSSFLPLVSSILVRNYYYVELIFNHIL